MRFKLRLLLSVSALELCTTSLLPAQTPDLLVRAHRPEPTAAAPSAAEVPAAAEKGPEIQAYCRYVQAVGESSSALLFAPGLFATFSNIPTSATGADDNLAGASRARLQVGVNLSPTRMYRGYVTGDVADAECQRYAAEARVPVVTLPSNERPALAAKAEVLREAIARGRELREALVVQLWTSLATIDEYGALALQVNGLESALSDTEAKLAVLPPDSRVDAGPALAALATAEDNAQAAQARLRRSHALEFEIRGGYYRIFGQEQQVPLFAIASLEFSPGWLWQGPADDRARRAHRDWLAARAPRVGPTPEGRTQMSQALTVTRERSRVLDGTLADLEARRVSVKSVPGAEAQRYADVMWLQLSLLRAEQAYLNAYAVALERALARSPASER
jgi:hypothetical protein